MIQFIIIIESICMVFLPHHLRMHAWMGFNPERTGNAEPTPDDIFSMEHVVRLELPWITHARMQLIILRNIDRCIIIYTNHITMMLQPVYVPSLADVGLASEFCP